MVRAVFVELVRLNDHSGARLAEIGVRDQNDIASPYRHSFQS
jgi:hypothetical protein